MGESENIKYYTVVYSKIANYLIIKVVIIRFNGSGARFSKRRRVWRKLVGLTIYANKLVGPNLRFSTQCKIGFKEKKI